MKLPLGHQRLELACAGGVPWHWDVAAPVYGSDRRLRLYLTAHRQPCVSAVPSHEPLQWGGPAYYKARVLARQKRPAWTCHVTLALLAHTFRVVVRHREALGRGPSAS